MYSGKIKFHNLGKLPTKMKATQWVELEKIEDPYIEALERNYNIFVPLNISQPKNKEKMGLRFKTSVLEIYRAVRLAIIKSGNKNLAPPETYDVCFELFRVALYLLMGTPGSIKATGKTPYNIHTLYKKLEKARDLIWSTGKKRENGITHIIKRLHEKRQPIMGPHGEEQPESRKCPYNYLHEIEIKADMAGNLLSEALHLMGLFDNLIPKLTSKNECKEVNLKIIDDYFLDARSTAYNALSRDLKEMGFCSLNDYRVFINSRNKKTYKPSSKKVEKTENHSYPLEGDSPLPEGGVKIKKSLGKEAL